MKLSDTGEFGLIDTIRSLFHDLDGPIEGIGDDCAVLPITDDRSLVITTDLLTEGTHFLADRISPHDLGYKSLAASLSDVASMGATPTASFLSLALTPQTDMDWCTSFLEGYRELSQLHCVALAGGDTTRSENGITVSVTAVGTIENNHIKRRSAARPGDGIYVTAPLGDSAGGLKAILAGLPTDESTLALIDRHLRPRPFVEEGTWLGTRSEVHAMTDISDGLASDLGHVLQLSAVAATIQTETIPFSPALKKTADEQGWNALELALGGGEDYCLLFSVEAAHAQQLEQEYRHRFGRKIHRIGEITPPCGTFVSQKSLSSPVEIHWLENDREIPLPISGFRHF